VLSCNDQEQTWRSVHVWSAKYFAFWMQTMGATLLRVRRCSLARTWMLARGSHSACGLLYLAAVRGELVVMEVSHTATLFRPVDHCGAVTDDCGLALTARQRQQRPHAGEP